MINIKSAEEIKAMRKAGRVVALMLQAVREAVRPGVTTAELDRLAEHVARSNGAVPAFKGFRGFPATLCTSVNEEVVHGIPGKRRLKEGDLISIDTGAVVDGYYGDAAITVPVGHVSELALRLISVTKTALEEGIRAARAGAHLSDISHAIQTVVEAAGFSVVRDYVGHGIGTTMWEEPQVPNYGPPGMGPILKAGMTLAIEPMVNAGSYEVTVRPDEWTVVTRDGSLSAHFEHSIVVTEDGAEILTTLERDP
ncbi:MAG TPA: type I methionyl aminopeptidase [Firmicutes bacterium]|nr:type I methionyl aminopeptidase [Bacillota bacterium]